MFETHVHDGLFSLHRHSMYQIQTHFSSITIALHSISSCLSHPSLLLYIPHPPVFIIHDLMLSIHTCSTLIPYSTVFFTQCYHSCSILTTISQPMFNCSSHKVLGHVHVENSQHHWGVHTSHHFPRFHHPSSLPSISPCIPAATSSSLPLPSTQRATSPFCQYQAEQVSFTHMMHIHVQTERGREGEQAAVKQHIPWAISLCVLMPWLCNIITTNRHSLPGRDEIDNTNGVTGNHIP